MLGSAVFAVFNPGTGAAPPGVDGPLNTILSWGAYIVCALAVAGILAVAGKMVMSHRQGAAGEHMSGLAWVLAGCILIASASGLVGVLV